MPRDVNVPKAKAATGKRQGQRAGMPVGVKLHALRFGDHGPIAKSASHIMRPRHGAFANPHPIIESRVTKFISAASSSPSLPDGLCGITRYRTSAVESQTLTAVSSGKVTPKSASTLRGSRTVRAR
mmetsp:Transcript_7588/g.13099  ORF Transcript_7588/g.13099 Transcript_7588/m.13099 type:complete len:126 (-) Transcript_7588:387-764(-)